MDLNNATQRSLNAAIRGHLKLESKTNLKRHLVKHYFDPNPQTGTLQGFVFDLQHGNKRLNKKDDLIELFQLLEMSADGTQLEQRKTTKAKGGKLFQAFWGLLWKVSTDEVKAHLQTFRWENGFKVNINNLNALTAHIERQTELAKTGQSIAQTQSVSE